MNKDTILIVGKEELEEFARGMFTDRLADRMLDSRAAAQVLGVSVSTLNRWIDRHLICPDNADEGHRVERKFCLSYLININVAEVKRQYRAMNQ